MDADGRVHASLAGDFGKPGLGALLTLFDIGLDLSQKIRGWRIKAVGES